MEAKICGSRIQLRKGTVGFRIHLVRPSEPVKSIHCPKDAVVIRYQSGDRVHQESVRVLDLLEGNWSSSNGRCYTDIRIASRPSGFEGDYTVEIPAGFERNMRRRLLKNGGLGYAPSREKLQKCQLDWFCSWLVQLELLNIRPARVTATASRREKGQTA